MRKLTWQDRCKETLAFHTVKINAQKHWSIRKTAQELNRSVGSISEDLNLAHGLRIYPHLEDIKDITEALKYFRKKQGDMKERG